MMKYLNASSIVMILTALFCFIYVSIGGAKGDLTTAVSMVCLGLMAVVMAAQLIRSKYVFATAVKRRIEYVIDSVNKNKQQIVDRYEAIKGLITDPVEANEAKLLIQELVDQMEETVIQVGQIRLQWLSNLENPKSIFELDLALQKHKPKFRYFNELIKSYEQKILEV